MANNNIQDDFPLPIGNSNTSSINLLPKYFRTNINKKFLSSTLDQMTTPGVVEKLSAFAGRRFSKATTASDSYLADFSADRENYQFEPVVVAKDELDNVTFLKGYRDYLGQLKSFKSTVSNHSILNSQEFYSWNPHIDWDKFVNFREYYWLPMGPDPIVISGQSSEVVSTYTISLSDEGDNYAYVFSPNGFTRNPRLDLYKEITYRFEVNTPGHPIAFFVNRSFTENSSYILADTGGIDYTAGENVSALYNDGIVKYDEDGKITDAIFIEKGIIEFTIPTNAPSTLYYISKNNINTSGIFNISNIEENTSINVDTEILGKKTYKASNGVELSNGMKVSFAGNVTPSTYAGKYFYVEGVGNKIVLISDESLEVPAIFTSEYNIPFDGTAFDIYPFEDATSFPGTKDYIVINRASADKNPWTRYNRWFHKDVIVASAEASNNEIVLDQDARAKRPIIEFEAGLKLFNHGTKAKQPVDVVDTFTVDAFSTIEGSLGYNVDGIDLVNGTRVLFTADTDILVNGRIYEVRFITHNGRRQISLIETADSVPNENETVLILNGNSYKGKMFSYTSGAWTRSQEKTSVNQTPLFDLFDNTGIAFNDLTYYPASTFAGNKVFSYKTGTGSNDVELGFPLSYQNIANIGDIQFIFDLTNDSFEYQSAVHRGGNVTTDKGYLKLYDPSGETYSFVNGWVKANANSKQFVIKNSIVDTQLNNFSVDMFDNSGLLTDLVVYVYVNGKKQKLTSDYTIENVNNTAVVIFNNDLAVGDSLVIKAYSSATKNANGFYEIPSNLEKNPLNESLSVFTLGEVNDHASSIIENVRTFAGEFPGASNLRDLGQVSTYGNKFIQHSGPLPLGLYHITDKDANIIKSIRYAKKEYAKFKRTFLNEAENSGFHGSVKEHVDLILSRINKDKTSTNSFYFSDMLGYQSSTVSSTTVEYPGPAYFAMSKTFDLQTLSTRSILVYLNGEQLVHGVDYTFENEFVYVTLNLDSNDTVEVHEFESTNGTFVPPTPTKLGLYPKYIPSLIVDTTYSTPQTMIQGHDGSLILAYNDYRDELILELERRIYNNIKSSYDVSKLNIFDFIDGVNRDTGFKKESLNNIMLSDFAQWLEVAGSPDYVKNNAWDISDGFTYNYKYSSDINGNNLDGFWRSIYKHYFDTDRPHTHPWEMLGLTIQPTWWEDVYGPAPYTNNNTVLWYDLQEGIIRQPGKLVERNVQFYRPGLLNNIPVNEYGQLLSPVDCGLAQNVDRLKTRGQFAFGDEAYVETAWRRSSEFPFAFITAWVLLQPSKLFGIGFDLSRISKDVAGNFVYTETNKRIQLSELVFPSTLETEELVQTSGLVNYVANYITTKHSANFSSYKEQLKNLNLQLAVYLGGFADKTKLKLVLDSRTPLNKGNVFVPEENYQIVLNTSSALAVPSLSGMIFEKNENGYILSGYDKESSVFYINPHRARNVDPVINVGGISESFVEWDENKQYVAGIIVRYENSYYRTKVTHESASAFEETKFTKLSSLPIVGGVSAVFRTTFEDSIVAYPYGYTFASIQEVVDFILGYENYCKGQGFIFDYYNSETQAVEDMRLCAKEFMFWVTQGWDTGSVITISPVGNSVKFSKDYHMVDDIFDNFYDYNILTGTGERLSKEFSSIYRTNANTYGLEPIQTAEGIFLVRLPLVQTEHVVLLDNVTVFNDIIYDMIPGYRQERIKLVGYRTDNWNGGLNIPGFFYDRAYVSNWNTWTDYSIGDLVKYKEFYYSSNMKHTSTDYFDANHWNLLDEKPTPSLYANWDYKVNQFTDFYDLDTDNFDTEQQRLGQHLIGYQKREYLANIINDDVSQYKFYQGFIAEKGTKNSLTKLFDALSSADKDSLEFFEEWAIALGQYGSVNNIKEVEYKIDEEKYRLEPQPFELVSSLSPSRTDLVYEIPSYDVYLKPDDYTHKPFPLTTNTTTFTRDSGYVRNDDVDYVVNTYDELLTLNIEEVELGNHIWIVEKNNTWDVVRHVNSDQKIIGIQSYTPTDRKFYENGTPSGFTLQFENYVPFEKDEIIGIYNNNLNINGFHKIVDVVLDKVSIVTETPVSIDINNPYEDSSGVISIFRSRRFADSNDINNQYYKVQDDLSDKIWVDDAVDSQWAVYKHSSVFTLQEESINPTGDGDGFASSFDVSSSNSTIVVGSPDRANGHVNLYYRFNESIAKTKYQEILPSTTIHDSSSKYGYSVAISPDGKYIAVGAPNASNVKTRYVGILNPTGSYTEGDIVSDRGTLWKANKTIVGDNSTISDLSQDWTPTYLIEGDTTGSSSGLSSQGIVYLYEKQPNSLYNLVTTFTSPDPMNGERFGANIQIRNHYNGPKIFIGAPGSSTGRIYFVEYTDSNWKYSRNRMYKGSFSETTQYYVDEIVYYEGYLYKASTNLAPGSFDLTNWISLSSDIEHVGFIPNTVDVIDGDSDSTGLVNATGIGYNFDVNSLGDMIVLSGSLDTGLTQNGDPTILNRIGLYRNEGSRWQFGQYIDTDDSVEDYAFSLAINDTGTKIAVGAPHNNLNGIDTGIVYIYKQVNGVFALQQSIPSPFTEHNESFGTGIDFAGNKLVISSKNGDSKVRMLFDNNATVFDNNSTRFMTVDEDLGKLYVFQEIGDNFVYAEDLIYTRNTRLQDNTNFKIVDNHIYIGFPDITNEDSTIGMLVDCRAERNTNSWSTITSQTNKVDVKYIKKVFLYNTEKNTTFGTVDLIDPRQGRIAGVADSEIFYKTWYDPAVYSVAEQDVNQNYPDVFVDKLNSWTTSEVGRLWWDISKASWYNPYQGSTQYRTAWWNKLVDGASIDVYEWTESDLTPDEYNRITETNEGFANGITGTPLHLNAYSLRKVYNIETGTFDYKYYFWVKNPQTIPFKNNRKLSAFDVAKLIEDPASTGYTFVALLGQDKFALYNARSYIEGTKTALHFTITNDLTNINNIHSEYQLLTENLASSKPNEKVETKWFDSLIGYDINDRPVPDTALSVKQKYGILNSPRQGMFINKTEALKQVVERANSVLLQNSIVDNYDMSMLLSQEEIPNENSGRYDTTVDTLEDLRFVIVAKTEQAVLSPVVEDGRIISVNIVNPGRGYVVAPEIKIASSSGTGAIFKTTINNLGQITSVLVRSKGKNYPSNTTLTPRKFSVLVKADSEIGGRWAIYDYNKSARSWIRVDSQKYNTQNYWTYADWYAAGYGSQTAINQTVNESYELFGLDNNIGDVVKINTIGSGGWLLLEKIDDQLTEDYTINYKTIGRENGTIQLASRLYDFITTTSGYDANIYDTAFYDREPVVELRNILTALRDDIFVGDLEVEWNKLFFASVRYAFSEQLFIDWAFKTSFIRAKHNLGNLSQSVTFKNDNLENYEDYVNEVKPYAAKVREYISSYTYTEPTQSLITDFDLPPSYNLETREIETNGISVVNGVLTGIADKYLEYPFKSWLDNNGYDIIRIDVADGGSGYTSTPLVRINNNNGTTARAYLSRGRVSSVIIDNTGGKYLTAPEITIEGSIAEGGSQAKAVAVLGNGVVRSTRIGMKFDRVSGSYLFTELDETQSFTGTGAVELFYLKWPIDLKTNTYSVRVNGVKQLSSQFVVGNVTDKTKTYNREIGYIEFMDPPARESLIQITYNKDIKLLSAADRINFFYNPLTGMLGKDLSQLMDGVDYTGTILDSIDFGTQQGFDVSGYGALPWDTFSNTYDDEIFVCDGSTNTFELTNPLEDGLEYNVYLNNVRIDDPEYDYSTVLSNPNALMQTLVGDGETTVVSINEELISIVDGDVVVIRKSTSDGSFVPTNDSYDTAIEGGNLAYTTAAGVSSGEINIDGDGFVTTTTSRGPEELVPGQILDTLDIQVYHRTTDGTGIIGVANFKIDGDSTSFALPSVPQSVDSVVVKIDNDIVSSDLYSLDLKNNLLLFDNDISTLGSNLSIMSIGTNGIDLLDTGTFVSDGSTLVVTTSAVWQTELSAFVTKNGEVLSEGTAYTLVQSSNTSDYPNRVQIVFDFTVLAENDFVQWTIYGSELKTYSQIVIDRTFEADGLTNYHKFDTTNIPIPFNALPISHKILVTVNDRILNPGYNISFNTTSARVYQIEEWQFQDTTSIDDTDIIVFADGVQLLSTQYSFDPVNATIEILFSTVAPAGSKLEIFVLKNADYWTLDTQITFEALPSQTLNLDFLQADDHVYATSIVYDDSAAVVDSTTQDLVVHSSDNNVVQFVTRNTNIRDAFVSNNVFRLDFDGHSSIECRIASIKYVLSDSIQFAIAPSSGEVVEIYTFSNHDVNDFNRISYDVLTTTSVSAGSSDYVKRNLLSSGIVELRSPITSGNYAWVIHNGQLLTPNVDYTLTNNRSAVKLLRTPVENDTIDILQFSANPVVPKFGYRMFKDIMNRTHYKRLNQNNSYVLKDPLNYYDARISLVSSAGITIPSKEMNKPGVVFIEGERIEYFEVVGNYLLQLRRGTLGTGIKNVYNAGSTLYGQGIDENIPYRDRTLTQTFIGDGTSTDFVLDFTPASVNEIDVIVAGRKLRKTSLDLFVATIDQDSPEADIVLPPEFTVDVEAGTISLVSAPAENIHINVVRRIGKVWNETGKALKDSENDISRFLRGATIQLPK